LIYSQEEKPMKLNSIVPMLATTDIPATVRFAYCSSAQKLGSDGRYGGRGHLI
jgi:hypothetical protein